MEKPLLKPLSEERFETERLVHARLDRYAQVTTRTNRYSVPALMIGRQVGCVSSSPRKAMGTASVCSSTFSA
ncbi:hypothetical protein A4G26_18050 [Mycobacterium kansasii]|uniref:Mu transposase domain-containing protein n=1 Tax=Mycobacterium innocens TaxID=2341083 RepID=UPI0007BE67D5|nr:hypothetical protein A4G26_18050 [Mycobacterium kansasii]